MDKFIHPEIARRQAGESEGALREVRVLLLDEVHKFMREPTLEMQAWAVWRMKAYMRESLKLDVARANRRLVEHLDTYEG